MADGPSSRRADMKDSASFSETGSDFGDNIPQGVKDDVFDNDSGFVEDRFRVDRKKLEQMLQGEISLANHSMINLMLILEFVCVSDPSISVRNIVLSIPKLYM